MRVVIDGRKIADYGIGTYLRGLLGGLAEIAEESDQYVVLAPAGAGPQIPFQHVVTDAPHYSLRELLSVGRAVTKARADVFHAPHYVLPFTNTPAVVTIHDLIHLRGGHRNPLAPLYARAMLRRAAHRSTAILTVTDSARRDIESNLGVTGVVVTPNGVHPRFSEEGPRRQGTYFLYVGNDKPHKNVGRLVEAFARLPQATDGHRCELVLVGASFERYRGQATLAGFVPDSDLPAFYRGAVALVMPSIEEGFGLPALEAMACGTPVITSMAGALVEVTGAAALHVDERDVEAMASAMTQVAIDDALRQSMITKGLERARWFTWRRCAELTREVYRTVAHHRPR